MADRRKQFGRENPMIAARADYKCSSLQLNVDMAQNWSPDQTFFDLFRDKPAINAMLKQVAGKVTADAHISSTAKVQKKIIQDCLNGTRKGAKQDWQPNYMAFPMAGYTKRGGIEAMTGWNAVKKNYG